MFSVLCFNCSELILKEKSFKFSIYSKKITRTLIIELIQYSHCQIFLFEKYS